MKLDALGNAIAAAGMAKAIDGGGVTFGASGWMTTNTQVAYRVVWGIIDANNNKIIGSPSQRIIVGNNSGGDRTVDLTFSIPSGITFSHFYQVYRSAMSGGITDEPDDELQLIVEKNPTAGEIAALSIVYTDKTPESLRGASLYTDPSQEGILQSNEPPPLARDACSYKQMALYANTVTKQRMYITIISVSGTGLVVNDTITIDGNVYTANAAENIGAKQFLCEVGLTPAENIDATAKSLIRVINGNVGTVGVYAYYLSGFNDLPGKILIEERGIGGAAYVAISSRGGAFNPAIPVSGKTYASTNDVSLNRIYISKLGQPESVPLLQYLDCGSADKNILRIVALRDSVFVQKEDGVFRIIGESPSTLSVSLFDSTTELLSIDSAMPFNNQVFAFTTQGIAAMSDSGVAIISRPIESLMLEVSAAELYASFQATSWGCSYESDRKYIFGMVTDPDDTYVTQQAVYNSITNTITIWKLPANYMILKTDENRIYYCNPVLGYVMQERKTFTNMDYADDNLPISITGQDVTDGRIVYVVSSANATIGWTLNDGTRSSVITSIPNGTSIVVSDYYTWATSVTQVYKPIAVKAKWIPIHGGDTSMVKHFLDLLIQFRNASFNNLSLTFNSDISGLDESVTVYPNSQGLWGYFPWGYASWGGKDLFLTTIRTFVPINTCRGRWLNFQIEHNQALSNFSIVGLSLNLQPISLKTK